MFFIISLIEYHEYQSQKLEMISSIVFPLVSGTLQNNSGYYQQKNIQVRFCYLWNDHKKSKCKNDSEKAEDILLKEFKHEQEYKIENKTSWQVNEIRESHCRAASVLTEAFGCIDGRNWSETDSEANNKQYSADNGQIR